MVSIIPGVISFVVAVGLLIYAYAGIGTNLMLCSGVHSEISGTVNFDSMLGAVIALYQLLTGDAWDQYLWSAVYKHGLRLWIAIYFLSYYTIVFLVMRSLLLALVVECYEACSNLDLKQFTLSPNLNEDDIDEANNAGDANLFLEYDRQQIISAQIASFDKASHRLANVRFLEDKKQFLLNRLQATSTENDIIGNGNTFRENGLRPQSIVENDVDKSLRVKLSRFIKEELQSRSSAAANNMNATALRRSLLVRTSITSPLDSEALKISSLVGRCVYTSEYPGNVNKLVAEALLLVSRGETFTDFILADLSECFEMLNNFGFKIDGVSSRLVMPSLCAAALDQMNRQAPPLPLTCGGVFAVSMVLRACNRLQACIRRKHVVSLQTQSVVVGSGLKESRRNHATHHQLSITPEFETSEYDMQSNLLGSPN